MTALASVVALANLIGALGYVYGQPVFYGALIAPTALPAGPRTRVRTVVVVTPDRRQCTAIERRDDPGGIALDDRGEGPMLRALQAAWTADELAGPPPAA